MWLQGPEAHRLVRQYEVDHLDSHYRSLSFWQTPPQHRAFSVLAAFDTLSLLTPFFAANSFLLWMHKLMEDSVSQCLRWILTEGATLGICPPNDSTWFHDAAQFLGFGSAYQTLVDAHTTYTTGLLEVKVEPDRKIVRFSPLGCERSWVNAVGQVENWDRTASTIPRRFQSISRVDRGRLRRLAMSACEVQNAEIRLNDGDALRDRDLQMASAPAPDEVWFPVPPDSDLSGFSAADLHSFWRILRGWSTLVSAKFLIEHDAKPQEPKCFPTQTVDQRVFVELIARCSGQRPDTVRRIIDRLSLSATSTSKIDVFLAPLIQEGGSITWSPGVVTQSRLLRNTLKAMVRTPSLKSVADTLIGTLEKPFLSAVCSVLARHRYQYKLRTPVEANGERGEIDILAWTDQAPDQLLLLECKCLLPADEVNEVKELTNRLIQGQTQAMRCVRILRAMDDGTKRRSFRFVPWDKVKVVYALVVNNEGAPNERYDVSEILYLDLPAIKRHLRSQDLRKPERIWLAAKERSWLQDLREARQSWRSTTVGPVTYEIPIFESDEEGE